MELLKLKTSHRENTHTILYTSWKFTTISKSYLQCCQVFPAQMCTKVVHICENRVPKNQLCVPEKKCTPNFEKRYTVHIGTHN